ncbi:MAG: type II glyceraldehyde-3-phosphate dehydrogenase [archaeon]
MVYKVGIVGYGTIGKRVADAVMLQDDMELVGITGNSYNYRMDVAKSKGIPIYLLGDNAGDFKENNIPVVGAFKDLLGKVDIIVDASPKPAGKENIEKFYKPAGVPAIIQGGEKHQSAECSFNAQSNYEEAVGKKYVRVVSCNTTGLSRTLNALHCAFGVKRARATLIRRASDPPGIKSGPVNAIIPSTELPSHHGPDVRTVIKDIEVFSTAIIVPTTLMHMHVLSVRMKKSVTPDEAREVLRRTTRIQLVREKAGIKSTAQIMELAKDMGYSRSDMMDLCIWEEGIGAYEDELFFMQAVHQESDVVPDNVDCIRAMLGFKDKNASIIKTNKTLNMHNPEDFDY